MGFIEEVFNFTVNNPSRATQILFSAVLAFATIIYTIATIAQVFEMRVNRKVRNKPIVKPTIENRYTVHYFFAVENAGKGTAYDVTAEWWHDPGDKHEWRIPILSPGERRVFPLPFHDGEGGEISTSGEIEKVSDGDVTIHFRARYDDSLGNSYPFDDTYESVNVMETIERREDESELADLDPLQVIADEMDEVADNLEGIENSIQIDKLNERADQEIHKRILDEVRERDQVTFKELKDGLGIERRLLAEKLHSMRDVGKIDFNEDYTGYFFKDAMDAEIEHTSEVGDL